MKSTFPFTILLLLALLSTFVTSCATSNAKPSYPNSYPSGDDSGSYPSDAENPGKPVQIFLPPAESADPDNPYAPLPIDKDLLTDKVYIQSSEVPLLVNFPPEFGLALHGSLPTPCHFLRVKINPPDEKNNIYIEVYSVTNPEVVCAQTLQSFDANIPLKNLIPGHYLIWVNGEKISEIDA